ncbi:MAG: sulfoxide reductase heme-binding subunit YedZ [Alphaproteobacteria bacterium]|nr:sulfoxide reductase heme-binding subunit YedZ [Alphaproteobacteria bacterium]MBV9861437.1 sulfoxide reductase heme-binding subunit YedZ [Alphaproteobacteria bacterium]
MKFAWNDNRGRLSPLKLSVFVALFLPAIWMMSGFALGQLGARPVTEAIHQIGLWTIRLLFIALAITPLRQIVQWPQLVLVRRMVGVAAFAYVMLHFTLYIADEAFDLAKVASEIVHRIYLTIGFVALCGLAALAATSTDRMVRRLGWRRWQRLHRLVYAIAVLGVIHYWMQSKLDIWEPTIFAGFYVWLMGYRLLLRFVGVRGGVPLPWVAGLGVAAAVLTALGEALYFNLAHGVAIGRVLAADFSLQTGLRPAVVVLAAGLAITAAGAARTGLGGRRKPGMGFA